MFDWNIFEARLHHAAVDAINRFSKEDDGDPICFFAFDSDPRYGYVLFAFDTLQNNVRSARRSEQYTIAIRDNELTRKREWRHAKYHLCSPPVSVYQTNSAEFAFPQYAEFRIPEWQKAAESGDYPQRDKDKQEDDYLDSNVRILFWNIAQRLVADNAFAVLNLASPFMIGYGIHDEEEQILRVLNWPGS